MIGQQTHEVDPLVGGPQFCGREKKSTGRANQLCGVHDTTFSESLDIVTYRLCVAVQNHPYREYISNYPVKINPTT